MVTPTVYVICDQNCKFEGMTKEQILSAIAQAVSTGEIKDVDAGFIQTIKTINGVPLKFFVGEQSAYDELTEEEKENLFAIITNDTTREGLLGAVATLQTDFNEFKNGTATLQTDFNEFKNGIVSGAVVAKNATNANLATKAKELVVDPFPIPKATYEITIGNYYYVDVKVLDPTTKYIRFGLFFFDGADLIIGSVVDSAYIYRLVVSRNGAFTLYRAQIQTNGAIGAYSDITSNSTFYVSLIGG